MTREKSSGLVLQAGQEWAVSTSNSGMELSAMEFSGLMVLASMVGFMCATLIWGLQRPDESSGWIAVGAVFGLFGLAAYLTVRVVRRLSRNIRGGADA